MSTPQFQVSSRLFPFQPGHVPSPFLTTPPTGSSSRLPVSGSLAPSLFYVSETLAREIESIGASERRGECQRPLDHFLLLFRKGGTKRGRRELSIRSAGAIPWRQVAGSHDGHNSIKRITRQRPSLFHQLITSSGWRRKRRLDFSC